MSDAAVSNDTRPVWSRDGTQLFYVSLVGDLMSVGVEPDILAPQPLFPVGERQLHDVAPGGDGFIMTEPVASSDPPEARQIRIVLDWFSELEELVPVP